MSSRKKQSLSGDWSFWKDSRAQFQPDQLPDEGKYNVQVPAPWQTQADDLRDYTGIGWYQRDFQVDAGWLEQRRLLLMFGAVDYLAQVWVNGQLAGEHEGGYLPFELDITELVREGDNMLVVRVVDTLEDFAEVPHGKQSWYGPISGIWQDVWMESRPERYIRRVRITPQGEQVQVEAAFNGALQPGEQLAYEVQAPDGQVVISGQADRNFVIVVSEPQVWSPETPNLYTLRLTLHSGSTQDTVEETFGFRTIETRKREDLAERAAAVPARRAGSGLLSRPDLHPTVWRIHRGAAAPGQRIGIELHAGAYQNRRPALLCRCRSGRYFDLDRAAQLERPD
jgi:beta-galactosidase/beta-glucuronidase